MLQLASFSRVDAHLGDVRSMRLAYMPVTAMLFRFALIRHLHGQSPGAFDAHAAEQSFGGLR